LERRRYGRTGVELSVVGFGGIVVMDEDPSSAARIVACKTGKRQREEAMAELHQSLERLRTDYFDLYQLHGVTRLEEVDQIMGEGGAIETLIEARDQGLVKYLGFSAHSEEAAVALLDRFEFDSVLFPINWVCWHQSHFAPSLVEKGQEKGAAILALKALAKRRLKEREERVWLKCWYAPVESPEEASLALRFTLSLPVTAAVSPSHAELLWWALDAAEEFAPLSDEEAEQVAGKTEGFEAIFPQ